MAAGELPAGVDAWPHEDQNPVDQVSRSVSALVDLEIINRVQQQVDEMARAINAEAAQ